METFGVGCGASPEYILPHLHRKRANPLGPWRVKLIGGPIPFRFRTVWSNNLHHPRDERAPIPHWDIGIDITAVHNELLQHTARSYIIGCEPSKRWFFIVYFRHPTIHQPRRSYCRSLKVVYPEMLLRSIDYRLGALLAYRFGDSDGRGEGRHDDGDTKVHHKRLGQDLVAGQFPCSLSMPNTPRPQVIGSTPVVGHHSEPDK